VILEEARVARRGDVPRIAELARAAAIELSGLRGGGMWAQREARTQPVDASLAALVDDPDALVLVGSFDGAVVGFATVRLEVLRDGSNLAVLDEIYVEPEGRGVGVGEALMDAVLAWCGARGCRGIDSLALPGDRDTKNFFERFGLTARAIIVHRGLGPYARPKRSDGDPA
jgi:GNAT superfamily N-acetyltransferase